MAHHEKPTLIGPDVTLRAAREDDVDARFALGNTPEIQAMFGADPAAVREITPEAANSWVQAQMSDDYAWVIEVGGRLIGALRLHSVNHADRRAQIAIGILDKDALGKGYGSQALSLLAAHAFDTMHLHRLGCRVLAFNARAASAYLKVGFEHEGRERESALIGSEWHDDLILGLLDRDLVRTT
jgi:RimJ/RimL family protein N-acetyltransferase